MASEIIGRAACPECDFPAAHVKRSEKGTVYRFCPTCGAQYFPRGADALAKLAAKTRPVAAPTGSDPTATPAGTATAAPAAPAPAPATVAAAPRPAATKRPPPTPPAPAPEAIPAAPPKPPAPAPARRGLGIFS